MSKLYKLLNDELMFIDTEYFEYDTDSKMFIKKQRTAEELKGYKELIKVDYPNVNSYESVILSYLENDTTITEVYTIIDKSPEEISSINEAFWEQNYCQIVPLGDKYIPYTSYIDGKEYDLLKDDLNQLVEEAQTGALFYSGIEVFAKPIMTNKINSIYLETLKSVVTDSQKLESIVNFIYEQNQKARTMPTVI